MHAAVRGSDRQRRLEPGAIAHVRRQIALPHHREESDQRWLAFTEHNRPAAHDCQLRVRGSVLDSTAIGFWKHTGEQSARREVPRSDYRVVANVAAHLEPARDFLRMIAFDAA